MIQQNLFDPPRPKPSITLSDDQAEVLEGMLTWCKTPSREEPLTVGGYAGVGKSTITGVFASEICRRKLVAFISFTGRAAGGLRGKLEQAGVSTTSELKTKESSPSGPLCTTVHRFLYKPVVNEHEEITGWVKRTEPDRPYDFVVIDEASMIGDRLFADIKALNVPIIAVGDHGQLPPVQDRGSLMAKPKLRLETIHRQAEGNPIIQLAHAIRVSGKLKVPKGQAAIAIWPYKDTIDAIREAYPARTTKWIAPPLAQAGIICYQNSTRVRLNGMARKAFGFEGAPARDELVVCLKNMHDHDVWNGMRGVLTENTTPSTKPWHLRAKIAFPEEGIPPHSYLLCSPQFMRQDTYKGIEELQKRGVDEKKMGAAGALFDFGYAMTCHKFQGSQVKTAVVVLDRAADGSAEWRRWAYTAVTRASERLILVR